MAIDSLDSPLLERKPHLASAGHVGQPPPLGPLLSPRRNGGGCGRLRGGREASVTQVTPQVAVEGDEFGMVNVVVKPDLYERQRSLVRTEPFVIVRGELQRRDGR